MKKFLVGALLVLMGLVPSLFADVYVNGYTKSNGTHVKGHYRSSPNSSKNDNWSTQGNTNPYTGKAGTKPRTPSYQLNSPKPKSGLNY